MHVSNISFVHSSIQFRTGCLQDDLVPCNTAKPFETRRQNDSGKYLMKVIGIELQGCPWTFFFTTVCWICEETTFHFQNFLFQGKTELRVLLFLNAAPLHKFAYSFMAFFNNDVHQYFKGKKRDKQKKKPSSRGFYPPAWFLSSSQDEPVAQTAPWHIQESHM